MVNLSQNILTTDEQCSIRCVPPASCHSSAKSFVFSIASYKRLEFNKHLLFTFIEKLDLDPDLILNHPNLPSVLSYGTLAA